MSNSCIEDSSFSISYICWSSFLSSSSSLSFSFSTTNSEPDPNPESCPLWRLFWLLTWLYSMGLNISFGLSGALSFISSSEPNRRMWSFIWSEFWLLKPLLLLLAVPFWSRFRSVITLLGFLKLNEVSLYWSCLEFNLIIFLGRLISGWETFWVLFTFFFWSFKLTKIDSGLSEELCVWFLNSDLTLVLFENDLMPQSN